MDEKQKFNLLKSGKDEPVAFSNVINQFVKAVIGYLDEEEIIGNLLDKLEGFDESSKEPFQDLKFENSRLESIFRVSNRELNTSQISDKKSRTKEKPSPRFFGNHYKHKGKYYYLSNQWNNSEKFLKYPENRHLVNFIDTFEAIYPENLGFSFVVPLPKSSKNKNISDNTSDAESVQHQTHSENNNMIRLSKPFLLLAGISGTGKTRFVREQAKASGNLSETYCLTSVRPDWHEPSDLLGYVSRLNDPAHYVTTDVLQFIAKAWRGIADADKVVITEESECLVVKSDSDSLKQVLPYWLCLDEMNLAPVEQYFADYLSVLETREWQWEDNNFKYTCDPLLKASVINQLAKAEQRQLGIALGFTKEGEEDEDGIWGLFCQHGIGIPPNLIVAGTVNMDETTHGFSRKVIDRALTFDFGDFFPNDFDQFFVPQIQNKILSYPIYSQARVADLTTSVDKNGEKSIEFLKAVNTILDNTPFKLAFRALNELLLAVISQNPQDDKTLKAIWDDFLMCKVLPRIEGDIDKLSYIAKSSDSNTATTQPTTILEALINLLEKQFGETFWDSEQARPDLFRQNNDDKPLDIACRSKAKLIWMQARLDTAGFTSFWP